MSKKIAAGAQAIVLDVKVGLGAFMQTLAEARELSQLMIEIGKLAGRQVAVLLSDMNQPLGKNVGNALELTEAIDTLHGGGPADFREHCLHVSAHMLVLGRRAPDLDSARQMAEAAIRTGDAFEKFRILVRAQGGDVSYVDDPQKFPNAKIIEVVKADRSGYLAQVHARIIGEAAVILGAGRTRKEDPVDHVVGFSIHRKVGEFIEQDQPLITIFANNEKRLDEVRNNVRAAFGLSDEPVNPLPLFYD